MLRDSGRTIIQKEMFDGALLEGARGLIDVMLRALGAGRISTLSIRTSNA